MPWTWYDAFFGKEPCSKCHGARLREEALHVLVNGKILLSSLICLLVTVLILLKQ